MSDPLARWRYRLEAVVAERDDGDPSHDLGHFRRVWNLVRRLAAAEAPEADMLVLLAASYLHDLVNTPKDSPARAEASRHSAEAAVALLHEQGFPADRLEAVRHAIEAHSYSAGIEPRSREAEILQDADRLESLGAVGLARLFAVSGRMGRRLFDPGDPFADRRPLDDVAFALDHVRTKLDRLPALMRTATGRRLAEARLAFVHRFLEELARELEPPSAG